MEKTPTQVMIRFTNDIPIVNAKTLRHNRSLSPKPRRPLLNGVHHLKTLPKNHIKPTSKPLKPWANDEKLDKLPVPSLNLTLERLVQACRPLASEAELEELRAQIEDFRPIGEKLQEMLENRAQIRENWLQEYWLKGQYLEYRAPLPINVSPAILFPPNLFKSGPEHQIEFAARLIPHINRYYDMILNRSLPIDAAGNTTMDMHQYDWLFGTYRYPGDPMDGLKHCREKSDHFVVSRKGHFYRVPLKMDQESLETALNNILFVSKKEVEYPVALFTGLNRSNWAHIYEELSINSHNRKSLDEIESAAFLLCLDDDLTIDSNDTWSHLGGQLLHGCGSSQNSINRWYDKTLQFVISNNGTAGVVYEHTKMEGSPVASLMDFLLNEESSGFIEPIPDQIKQDIPNELTFELSEEIKKKFEKVRSEIDEISKSIEFDIFTFEDFGKNFPKSQKISPDSFIQIAIALTYYEMHGRHVAQYETGTLRQFRFGRTETIRLPTSESADFISKWIESNKIGMDQTKKSVLKELFLKAITSHKDYVTRACSGKGGIDRHLLGLRRISEENGIPIHPIFKSKLLEKLKNFVLSTSQLPCKSDMVMVYGPATTNGYGVCYNPCEEKIHIAVSAMTSGEGTNAKKYGENLRRAFRNLKNLCID